VDTGNIAQHGALSGVWPKQCFVGDIRPRAACAREFMAVDGFGGNRPVAHRHCPGFTPPAFRSAPL